MHVTDAQRDVRTAYLGGAAGQTVSGILWLGSAALATWSGVRPAILLLVVGGFFIFPATRLALRALAGRGRTVPDNPLATLGWQVAFVLPLSLPLVGAATLNRLEWFYPAFMIALGAHYLPFAFLYGMPMFVALAGILVGGGFVVGRWGVGGFATGGWLTGAVLLAFGALGWALVRREEGAKQPAVSVSRAAEGT